MSRIFIFSHSGKSSFQTGYYRLLSLASFLSKENEVYFINGTHEASKPIETKDGFSEITLSYSVGALQKLYSYLRKRKKFASAKLLLMAYYFFTGREIFDLGKVFAEYASKINLQLTSSDIVIVSFPSIAVHNLGYYLKKKFGSKLILDYRDPGVYGYRLIFDSKLTHFLRKLFLKRREVRNLDHADKIITVSKSLKNLFPNRYADKIEIIRNGILLDKIYFERISYTSKSYTLVYLGTIYNIQLEELVFFKALRKFLDDYKILPNQFQLKFVGSDTPVERNHNHLKNVITKYGLDPYTVITPRMPIGEAYEQLYDANMFLHLRFGDRREIITSKQYEYLAFQKPILLPVSDNGDLKESILDNHAGFVCTDVDDVVNTLKLQYELFLAQISNRVPRTEQELFELSRTCQEQKFNQLITELGNQHRKRKRRIFYL